MAARSRRMATEKYAAKLLYQYAAVSPHQRTSRRLCEESTIVLRATSAREALRLAKRHARRRYFTFRTVHGVRLALQFVGVRELIHLGPEHEPEEVWSEFRSLVRPMERRAKLLPRESDLNAIQWETPGRRISRTRSGRNAAQQPRRS
jgi:hypothetical protein